jgi:hypothetical protein
MSHKLIIDVKDSTVNNKYIYVQDLSEWDTMLDVRYRRFQVLAPFAEQYIIIALPQGGQLALTSINLGLASALEDIPDGFYNMHYSVSPNDQIFVEMGHYRVAKLMNLVLGKMALIDQADNSVDNCGNVMLDKQQNTLVHIWMLLKGCQQVAREVTASSKADTLYRQAMREYDKLFDETCVSC